MARPMNGAALDDEQVAALAAALIARETGQSLASRRRDAAAGEPEEGWQWRLTGRRAATSGSGW